MRDNDRERVLAGHLGRGFILSFLFHSSLIFPFHRLAIVFARREAAEADLDVHFEDVSAAELPDDLPPLTPEDVTAPELPTRPKPPKLAERMAKEIEAKPEKLQPVPDRPLDQPPPPKPKDPSHQKM